MRTNSQLREDALAIWQAGVDAVRADRLVQENLRIDGDFLLVDDEPMSLADIRRVIVVGAGKAGAGMAAGVEAALGARWMADKQLTGWINVPADCVRTLSRITLHAARPAGVNEPTADGVAGAEAILRLVTAAGPNDLCLCLISGGGSALLPAPVPEVSLAEKQAITKFLSAAGANIQQLNTVRKQLSRIKGGGLARACNAGRLVSLVISDVLGDPLDIIASGPTVEDSSTPAEALAILQDFGAASAAIAPQAIDYLRRKIAAGSVAAPMRAQVSNLIIGNNAVAVDGAGIEAVRRGYSPALLASRELEGVAEDIGRHTARMALRMKHEAGPDCLITGGEPTVKLAPAAERGKGGRNQQLVLAAFDELTQAARGSDLQPLDQIALLSGGTDGEDGPTDAAGAIIDATTPAAVEQLHLDAATHLRRNDAYHFFQPLNGLIQTGPTHTNVCDLRIVVVSR